MARKLKEAIARNQAASEELNEALRHCLSVIRNKPEVVVEGRFRVLSGGKKRVMRH